MKILITGVAGYIGSHVAKTLIKEKHIIIGIDNLSLGLRSNIKPLEAYDNFTFLKMDIKDIKALKALFRKNDFDCVIHLAALTKIEKSVQNPLLYYEHNCFYTLNLLLLIKEFKLKYLVFASSAAVYANSSKLFVSEDDKLAPSNPYGLSKLICEQMIKDFAKTNPIFKYAILRYFNVAGFSRELPFFSFKKNEKNHSLINAIALVATGFNKEAIIYGNDYPTKDGTAMRDFIHVEDVAKAHSFVLDLLASKNSSSVLFNIAQGKVYSVMDIILVMQKLINKKIPFIFISRRKGDIAAIAGDCSKITRLTSFKAAKLEDICKDTISHIKNMKL